MVEREEDYIPYTSAEEITDTGYTYRELDNILNGRPIDYGKSHPQLMEESSKEIFTGADELTDLGISYRELDRLLKDKST